MPPRYYCVHSLSLAGRDEDLHEAFVTDMEPDEKLQARLDAEHAHNRSENVAFHPWPGHAP